MLVAATLISEAFVVFFAGLVAHALDLAPSQTVWTAVAVVVALALLGAGLASSVAGIVIGSVVQAALVAASFLIGQLWVVTAVFLAIWAASLAVGTRIDRERQQRAAMAAEEVKK